MLRLGFMGFGEVAPLFARDFARAGITRMAAYSPSAARAQAGSPLHALAQSAGVELVNTPQALADAADIIFALTPARHAYAAARSIRDALQPHHLYIDASAASARDMERIAALIGEGARFVDAAIMGPVVIAGMRIPIVASGVHAHAFHDTFAPLGMNIKIVGANPGDASAMKLIRSVCMKGLTALLFESLELAHRRGMLDACIEDFSATFNDMPFEKIIKRFVCSTPAHVARRIDELQESLELLHAESNRDRMALAVGAFLNELAATALPRQFTREADTVESVIAAWIAAKDNA